MLCLCGSAAHQHVDFPHHLRKQSLLLIASSEVFSKGCTLCLSPSVVSVLSADDSQPEAGIRGPSWPPHVARRGRPRTVALDLVKDPRGEVTLRNTVTAHHHCFCSKIPETGGQGLWGCHTNLFLGCHQGGSPCDCRDLRVRVQFFVFLGKMPKCSYCAICVRFLWCMKLA